MTSLNRYRSRRGPSRHTRRQSRLRTLLAPGALALSLVLASCAASQEEETSVTSPSVSTPETAATREPPIPDSSALTQPGAPAPLTVHDSGRYLVDAEGDGFVYQADTAWALISRTTPEDVVTYLDARQAQGFNVIQTVAIFPIAGPEPNYEGHYPYNSDVGNPNEAYFEHADFVIDEIQKRGMYVALFPVWMWGAVDNGHVSAESARAYGEWIGERYADQDSIIWVMGGDSRQYDQDVDRAMAAGVTVGVAGSEDYSATLMSYHPGAPQTSGPAYHDEPWLDFNMVHTSHCAIDLDFVRADVQRDPPKPAIDAESMYEDHPLCWDAEQGYSTPAQVRAGMYGSVFAGGMGYVYGNQATWQMYSPERKPIFDPVGYWYDLLDRPAANQAKHLRTLIELRPLGHLPHQELILSDAGAGWDYVAAITGVDESWSMVYTTARPFTVDLDRLGAEEVAVTWFDPRTGASTDAAQQAAVGEQAFTPPSVEDWVLILDTP